MTGPLLWLAARRARNRFVRATRQVRHASYALALLAAVAVLFLLSRNAAEGTSAADAEAFRAQAGGLGLCVLLGALLWGWFVPIRRGQIDFTPTEEAWLLSAPIARSRVIGYKLAAWQGGTLVTAATVVLVQSGSWTVEALLRRVIGLWAVFSLVHLHHAAASLERSVLRAGGARRGFAVLPFGVLLAHAVVIGIALQPALRSLSLAPLDALRTLPALAGLRAVLAPALASDLRALLASLPAVLGLLAAHAAWIIWADARLADSRGSAASDAAERRRQRKPSSPVLLRLGPSGHPAVGLLWRQMAGHLRRGTVVRAALLLLLAVVLVTAPRVVPAIATLNLLLGAAFFGVAFFALLAGPMYVSSARPPVPWLRSLPLSGTIIVGTLAAANVVTTLVAQLAILGAYGLAFTEVVQELFGSVRLPMVTATAVVVPATLIGSVVVLVGPILLPKWFGRAPTQGGLATLGVGTLSLLFYLLAVMAGLVLPAAAAIGIAGIEAPLERAWRLGAGVLTGWAIAAVEAVALVVLLGDRLETVDDG